MPLPANNIIPIRVEAYAIKEDGTDSYTLPYMDPDISVTNLLLGRIEILFALATNENIIIKSTYN
jgi:hypothetical protein